MLGHSRRPIIQKNCRNHSERAVRKSAWNYGPPQGARIPRTGTKSHGRSVFGSKYMAKTWFRVILDRFWGACTLESRIWGLLARGI